MTRTASSTPETPEGGWLEWARQYDADPSTPKPLIITPSPSPDPESPTYVAGCWFDDDAVTRVVRFFTKLPHTATAQWAGRRIDLEDWQIRYLVIPVYGWMSAEGHRIVRTAWEEFPRKQGKSTIGAGQGLYLTAADREWGAEVYVAAGSKRQAGNVFSPARRMALSSRPLRKRLRVLKSLIEYRATGSQMELIASDGALAHGFNVHGAVVDEVWAHKNRETIDALESGSGSRLQPLVIFLTTADEDDKNGVYDEKRELVELLAGGHAVDPTFYGVVFAAARDQRDLAERGLDPFADETLALANPGAGTTTQWSFLRSQAVRAKNTPRLLPEYLRLHLGVRYSMTTKWLPLSRWDEQSQPVDYERMRRRPTFGALDLSAVADFTAFTFLVPDVDPADGEPIYWLHPMFWVPEGGLVERARQQRLPLVQWALDGHLRLTEGDAVDYAQVRRDIHAERRRLGLRVEEIAYDPWNAPETALKLKDIGYTMVPHRQGYASMSAPSKEFERRMLRGRFRHGGHPILRWMVDCVEIQQDPAGNIKPVKPHRLQSSKRIDGVVASIMALDRALRHESDSGVRFL